MSEETEMVSQEELFKLHGEMRAQAMGVINRALAQVLALKAEILTWASSPCVNPNCIEGRLQETSYSSGSELCPICNGYGKLFNGSEKQMIEYKLNGRWNLRELL